MTKTNYLKLGLVCAATIFATTTTAVYQASGFENKLVKGLSASSYTCADIIFGENTYGSGSRVDLTTEKSLNNVIQPTSVLQTSDFTLTGFQNAQYKNKVEDTYYFIRIGLTSKENYSGQFTLTLTNGYTCDRLLVYAATYTGDVAAELSVNDMNSQTIHRTYNDEYEFKPYTFENINSNILTFKNTIGATGTRRIAISKLVFRLKQIV